MHTCFPILFWCGISDAFQTSAIEAVNDFKLKHLVDIFQLSDELLGE
jgi:hypothetical protein